MIVRPAEALTWIGKQDATGQELAMLNLFHRKAERAVKSYCHTELEQATFTEYHPHEEHRVQKETYLDVDAASQFAAFSTSVGPDILRLRNVPVRSITSVYEYPGACAGQISGGFPASSLLTAGSHYWLDTEQEGISKTGFLRKRVGNWPSIAGSVKVTYVAGYTANELDGNAGVGNLDASDIKLAVYFTLAHYWNRIVSQAAGLQGGIKTSESLGDYSYQLGGAITKTEWKVPATATDLLQPYVQMGY